MQQSFSNLLEDATITKNTLRLE